MSPSCPRGRAAVFAIVALGLAAGLATPAAGALALQSPGDLEAWSVFDRTSRRFVVWLTWRDHPDSVTTFTHPPDLTGWAVTTPPAQMTQPSIRGAYNGDIDRTFVFRSTRAAAVGVDSVRIAYEIRREEHLSGTLVLRPSYVPGTWVRIPFRNQRTGATVDFGFEMSFSAGRTDVNGGFTFGAEDFEGFHIWRGVEPDGSDLTIIGELSKEEAFKGRKAGGDLVDSLYYYQILPELRASRPWFSQFGAVDCLGTRIDLPLESDQLFWFDCDAVNGFTYYYGVTTFDRGYTPSSSTPGLVKFDHCPVTQGMPYPCRDELVPLRMEVDAQDDLYRVYAVPNPFRSGSSRLTSENYHNFPDQFIRFVNVPSNCTVKIFTVSGDLVWERVHQDGTGNIEWDVTNRDSQPVTSGVYVYRVETGSGESVYGRIIVIR